jgi:hypothetical protein
MTNQARKVNFFLIGAAKAGTTSIDRFLRSLPEVFLSPIKEPCHFCPDINEQIRAEAARQSTIRLDKYLDAGCPEIVHQHIVERPEDYAQLFAAAPEDTKILGECSTFYLVSADAPSLVHSYNPDAKIVAILRDPSERIRSHYEMDRRIGLERRDLIECIQEEVQLGDAANYGNCRFYLGASNYLPHIMRWIEIFGRENVLILDFADLSQSPEFIQNRLIGFLGVSAHNSLSGIEKINDGRRSPRLGLLDHLLYRLGLQRWLKIIIKASLPKAVVRVLARAYFGVNPSTGASLNQSWMALPQVEFLSVSYKKLISRLTG